eukprot:TRINITY_DN32974_c0_g1_i1.p1 TRINITY_DN32974_c0_g1~~TRINITY_DN32974_c0_g1_i1.p1  ORF type:complete len:519 (+),score=86.42 TRINITY_DN32974_c0_g1_i1:44-1558(+)
MAQAESQPPFFFAFDVEVPIEERTLKLGQSCQFPVHRVGRLSLQAAVYASEREETDCEEEHPSGDGPLETCFALDCWFMNQPEGTRFAGVVAESGAPTFEGRVTVRAFCDSLLGDSPVTIIENEPFTIFPEGFSERCVGSIGAGSLEQLRDECWLTARDSLFFRVEVTSKQSPFYSATHQPYCPDDLMLKMWLDKEYTDFHVVAKDGHEIHCHRAVLSAASPVFKGMISGEMQEGLQQFVKMDEPAFAVSSLLEFVYTGSLPEAADCSVVLALLRLSDYYQLPHLAELCAARLGPLLSGDNVQEVLGCLSVLKHAGGKYEDLFFSVVDLIRRDMNLALAVCMSAGSAERRQDEPDVKTQGPCSSTYACKAVTLVDMPRRPPARKDADRGPCSGGIASASAMITGTAPFSRRGLARNYSDPGISIDFLGEEHPITPPDTAQEEHPGNPLDFIHGVTHDASSGMPSLAASTPASAAQNKQDKHRRSLRGARSRHRGGRGNQYQVSV